MRVKTPESVLEGEMREHIRHLMKLSSVSQAQLSRELDVSQQHLSDMLTGKSTLGLHHSERIAHLCGWELCIAFRPKLGKEKV